MNGQNRIRSLSLDGLDYPSEFNAVIFNKLSNSSDSVHPSSSVQPDGAGCHECNSDEDFAPDSNAALTSHKRYEANRIAWEVGNRFDRRTQAARQIAFRTAAILQMRKNSTALKVASMENKQKDMKEAGNCRQNVKELRIRLSALDLELQKSNSSAVEHLSSLENCREQHLQLLRELGELENKEYGDHQNNLKNDEERVASSLPCLSKSPKSRKQEKMSGLKRVAINTTWGRKLGSKLGKGEGGGGVTKQHSFSCQSLHPTWMSIPQPSHIAIHGSPCVQTDKRSVEKTPLMDIFPSRDVSPEALAEIDMFKQLIKAYFAGKNLAPYLQ